MGREEDEQAMTIEQEAKFVNHLLRLIDVQVARLGGGDGVGITSEILVLLEKTASISPQATASLKLRLGWRLNRIAEVGSYQ